MCSSIGATGCEGDDSDTSLCREFCEKSEEAGCEEIEDCVTECVQRIGDFGVCSDPARRLMSCQTDILFRTKSCAALGTQCTRETQDFLMCRNMQ